MFSFLIKRILYGLLVLFGVVTAVFFLFNNLSGDPAQMMMGQRSDVSSIETINKDLGRNFPLHKQYFMYLNDISPISFFQFKEGDGPFIFDESKHGTVNPIIKTKNGNAIVFKKPYLRRSYQSGKKVSQIIYEALPGTAILALAAIIIATLIGISLGVWTSLHHNTFSDRFWVFVSILGMAVPSFFASIIIAWLFGYVFSDITGLNMTGSLYAVDPFKGESLQLKNLILPALTLGIRPLAIIVQLTRNSMLDVLSQDYIRTARSKGLSKNKIVWKHAIKNALNPVITAISGWFGSLLAGAVFVEYIFGWKGIGKLTIDALDTFDFPVVMGAVLVVSFFFIIINILVDIVYGIIDPRIRLQ
ncbi:MAG: ABC transporter permease [Bacteroidia bacterium]|nr:ABC transporter permease [Bacteroidia bacterium]NNC85038.1 ABC transporter permease [Bacteroidia bacterium]NNM15120.1 ABC transporter permease [Bacteroidia bacterium]